MKINICIYIILFCNLNLLSNQLNEKYKLTEILYSNSTGENGVTYLNYNSIGLSDRALWQLFNGKRSSVNFHFFNKENKLIKRKRIFSDGLNSEELFLYDKEGNLAEEKYKNSKGITGNGIHIYKDNKVSNSKYRNYKGWLTCSVYYKYNDNGLKIFGEIKKDKKHIGKIFYKYNKFGLLEFEKWVFKSNWSQTFIYKYSNYKDRKNLSPICSNIYLNLQKPVKLMEEKYSFGKNEAKGKSFFKYDFLNRIVEKIYVRDDGLKTTTYFFYNLDNLLLKSLRIYSNGNFGIFSYFYNNENQINERNYIDVKGNKAFEKYFYKNRKLKKAMLSKFDNWISGTIVFNYKNNRINSGDFEDLNKKYNAKIYFYFNDLDLLESIVWNFSFKKEQKYNFKYGK